MSYVDIAIIVLVALGALIGLWKGFFKTIISFFGWLVSFVIAFFLTKMVAAALLDVGAIRGKILGESGSLFSAVKGFLPEGIETGEGIWGTLLAPLLALAQTSGADVRTGVALLVTNSVYSVIVCIALFIAIRIVMLIFTMFANAITANRTVGAINRLFGFIVGAVKGFGGVCLIMVVMTFLMGFGFMTPVKAQLDKSVIGAPLYNKVFELKDKFVGADGNLLDKLLTMAGIEKTPSEDVLKAEAQAKLKIALADMKLKNGIGDYTEDTFNATFITDIAEIDYAMTKFSKYFADGALKMDVVLADYTSSELNGFIALLAKADSDVAAGAINAAVNTYFSKLKAIVELDKTAADYDAILLAKTEEVKTSLTALNTAINANTKFATLFGTADFKLGEVVSKNSVASVATKVVKVAKQANALLVLAY